MRIIGLLFRWGSAPAAPSLFWRDTETLTDRQRGQFSNSQTRGLVTIDRWRGKENV
jgi:hypothetical protein